MGAPCMNDPGETDRPGRAASRDLGGEQVHPTADWTALKPGPTEDE